MFCFTIKTYCRQIKRGREKEIESWALVRQPRDRIYSSESDLPGLPPNAKAHTEEKVLGAELELSRKTTKFP